MLVGFITGNHSRTDLIDAIELDLDTQAVLRGIGFNVIDADFLQFDGASMYSHVLLNPPFSQGAEHVVKVFSLIASGELVAIVNAETVRNPFSSTRKLLVKFIEDHGSIEFMDQAFTDPDTLRKTNVEIALIHLDKKVDLKHGFTQNRLQKRFGSNTIRLKKLPGQWKCQKAARVTIIKTNNLLRRIG